MSPYYAVNCAYTSDCPDPPWKSGLCKYHYGRRQYLKKIGKTEDEVNSWRWNESLEDKLWAELVRGEPAECWPWTGRIVKGYGQVWHEGKHLYTHIVAYELLVGPVPEGLDLDHECHNESAARGECTADDDCPHRRCGNPAHLAPKPRGDNLKASPLWRKAVGMKDE